MGESGRIALAALSLVLIAAIAEVVVRALGLARLVGPVLTVYDPIYGKRLKRSFAGGHQTPEFTTRFTTNALGFRGPEPPAGGRGAILFLGDSYTAGFGVSDGEDYPSVVRRALGGHIPVLNAGLGNSGTGRWIPFLAGEAGRYEPRQVVLQVCGNDFRDDPRERMFIVTADGGLADGIPRRRGLGRAVQSAIERIPGVSGSHVVALARTAAFAGGARGPAPSDPQLTLAIVERALAACARRDWPVLLLAVRIEGVELACLEGLAARHGVELVRVPNKAERPELYYRVDGHWNRAGHEHVGRLVLEHVAVPGRDP